MNDSELLQRYARDRCEASFGELVARYIDLVHSAALRQLNGNVTLAQDVTQTVFIDLARKAGSLSARTVLAGWLYTSTRFAAAKIKRAEQRRQTREQEANHMQELLREDGSEPGWERIAPLLDEAMHALSESDRNAVLVRYFEGRPLAQVGSKLGLSEEAARKRVSRALEKLRSVLARRGVRSSAAGLVAVFAHQAVSAAPAGLALKIAGTAAATAGSGAGISLTLLKIMTMTNVKLAVVSTVLIVGVATPLLMQHQTQTRLRAENEQLRVRADGLAGQISPLTEENLRLSNLTAGAGNAQWVEKPGSNELLRLRAEVARLREDSQALARLKGTGLAGSNPTDIDAEAQSLAARAAQLKKKLEQMPDKGIPELQFLSQKDWLDAVSDFKQLETEEEYRRALSELRSSGKSRFGNLLKKALKDFAQANGGALPSDLSQLAPFFGSTLDSQLLQRYQLMATGQLSEIGEQTVIAEIAPAVDDEYDTHFEFRLNGTYSRSVSKVENALEAAAVAYAASNQGLLPRKAAQLESYLHEPVAPERVHDFLSKVPSNITTMEQYQGLTRR